MVFASIKMNAVIFLQPPIISLNESTGRMAVIEGDGFESYILNEMNWKLPLNILIHHINWYCYWFVFLTKSKSALKQFSFFSVNHLIPNRK